MIKNIFISLFLVVQSYFSLAQPTIDNTNYSPPVGIVYVTHSIDPATCPVGTDGVDVIWDYADILFAGSTSTFEIMDPASTPYSTYFPESNLSAFSDETYSYYNLNNFSFELNGIYNDSGFELSYSNPETLLSFPFTYNTVTNDSFACDFNYGIYYHRSGSVQISGVGYGTLILPYGTFFNALKIKIEKEYQDEYDFGAGPQISYHSSLSYDWYLPWTAHPVLVVNTSTGSSGTSESAFLLDALNITLSNDNNIDCPLSVYPNPTNGNINVDIDDLEKIEVFNGQGQIIGKTNENIIDITDQPTGIYFIRIYTIKEITTRKIYKK